MADSKQIVLSVKGLKTQFKTQNGPVTAVDGISFEIAQGKTLGLVGESGCGKSVTGLSLMRLIQHPGFISQGEVYLDGEDLLKLSDKQMRDRRGGKIAMIFQDPMTSLDPLYPVKDPLKETLKLHRQMSASETRPEIVRLMQQVAITDSEKRMNNYPHQFSGGMRQRILIATALAGNPRLLIADEPTTALDVTVQAQILALMRKLQRDTGTALLLITHNLGVVAENCNDVAVMYAGNIVESAPVGQLFEKPLHPYTQGLLKAMPGEAIAPRQPLSTIPGSVPGLSELPSGCRFRNRCSLATEICANQTPQLKTYYNEHLAACHHIQIES